MTVDEDVNDQPVPESLRGHVRIWRNSKGQEQWSVTARVGESLAEVEEARAVARRVADRLGAGSD